MWHKAMIPSVFLPSGNITFQSKKTGIKLKEAWDTFLIDSVELKDLQWISNPQNKV